VIDERKPANPVDVSCSRGRGIEGGNVDVGEVAVECTTEEEEEEDADVESKVVAFPFFFLIERCFFSGEEPFDDDVVEVGE